jgi:hypothetical protein
MAPGKVNVHSRTPRLRLRMSARKKVIVDIFYRGILLWIVDDIIYLVGVPSAHLQQQNAMSLKVRREEQGLELVSAFYV